MKLYGYIIAILMLWYTPLCAQGLFATSGSVSSCLDWALGECFTAHTQPAEIGFIPSLYYSFISSEKQLTDTASIQVHFDNTLQQATIFMSHELVMHHPSYRVCNVDGNVYIQGTITSMPHFIRYSQLPSGIYILHISGIPGRIPHTTRWIKK